MRKARKSQKSNSFMSNRSERSSDNNNSSKLQHSINSSANSDSEDTNSNHLGTTGSVKSVNASTKFSISPKLTATSSSESIDSENKSIRKVSGIPVTDTATTRSFRIPASASSNSKDNVSNSLLTTTTRKESSSVRITQKENGSLRIVHQERSVRIIDTAIPENSTLVPAVDPFTGNAMAGGALEDVEACKFHKREVVHDSTIEGIKTLGMVLGKTTNQASKAIGTIASSKLFVQTSGVTGGIAAQKVMVVPVDFTSESVQPVPHFQIVSGENDTSPAIHGEESENSQRTHSTVAASSLAPSPLASFSNVFTGRRVATPSIGMTHSTSRDDEYKSQEADALFGGGRVSTKAIFSAALSACDPSIDNHEESDLIGIMPNQKPLFPTVSKPANSSPILPQYAQGSMFDVFGIGQTCVVDSSTVVGEKKGLWHGLSAFDDGRVNNNIENEHSHYGSLPVRSALVARETTVHFASDAEIVSTANNVQNVNFEVNDAYNKANEGDAAVDEAIFGDKATREERDRERMLLGSRSGLDRDRSQLGSRNAERGMSAGGVGVGGLLAMLDRQALSSRGGVRWSQSLSEDAWDMDEGDTSTRRNGTISRMLYSIKLDMDNSLPYGAEHEGDLDEDDDRLPMRWPFTAPLPLPQSATRLQQDDANEWVDAIHSGRLSEPEGDMSSICDMGSVAGGGSIIEGIAVESMVGEGSFIDDGDAMSIV